MMAILLVVLFGVAGLALDAGEAFEDYRRAQTAADAAALAGAFEKFYGRDGSVTTSALDAAADNGFTDGTDNVDVVVSHPPVSGFYTGDDFSVEVTVSQPSETFFLKVLGVDSLDYRARAVANGNTAEGFNCIFVLDLDHEKAFEVSSDSLLDARCGIWVNSDDREASSVESGACVKARTVTVVGGYKKNQQCDDDGGPAYECSAAGDCPIYGHGKPQSERPIPTPDPFAGLPAPDVDRRWNSNKKKWKGCAKPEKCDQKGCSGKEKDSGGPYEPYTIDGGNKTLKPGHYCGGIHVKKGKVTLEPGLYILRGGGLRVEGGDSEIIGHGVTFYNTCFWECDDPDSDHDPEKGKEWFWTLDINSSAKAHLTAPPCDGGSSGNQCTNPLDGILFFSDRLAPASKDPGSYPVNRIDSSSDATLSGGLYVWNQHLKFHSNAAGERGDDVVVAKFLEVSSNSRVTVNTDRGDDGSGSPLKRVTLVE